MRKAMNDTPFPNADKVGDFIESESDPVTRSLMRLVYGEFLRERSMPDVAVDMLYCFKILRSAFLRKDAVANALKGDYGRPNQDLEWT
jgi:hypothetical protein